MTCHCTICGIALAGGFDTFGPRDQPMCWNCHSELASEGTQPYYGLGPHHHDLSLTGSIFGSTVLDDQNDPDFTPDPDAPGLGVWHHKAKGWQ